jgi:hypothetical protein
MPRYNNDIVAVASTCFHLNVGQLVPDYIVIRSPRRKTYSVTTLDAYLRNSAAGTSDDWLVALNLPAVEIMSLMAVIPKPADKIPLDDLWNPSAPSPEPLSEIREVAHHASSPQDI